MAGSRRLIRPGVERLDPRVVLSTVTPTVNAAATSVLLPPTSIRDGTYPSANRFRSFTPADLALYAQVYQSFIGAPDFQKQYDFNGTGFIGQNDATPILRGLAAITPKIPLTLSLKLAPGEAEKVPHVANNGPVTRLGTVTVIGTTTPNSIVFIDGPTTATHSQSTGNFKFEGGALATDAQGHFYYTVQLPANSRGGSILGANFLIRTPFNQQLIRSYPIRRVP